MSTGHIFIYLHMLPEAGGVGVRLVASPDFTVVWFVGRVHMTMLLAITRVGESTVAAFKVAFKRLLT